MQTSFQNIVDGHLNHTVPVETLDRPGTVYTNNQHPVSFVAQELGPSPIVHNTRIGIGVVENVDHSIEAILFAS